MKIRRIWFYAAAIALLWLFESVMTVTGAVSTKENQGRSSVRWDLVEVSPDLVVESGTTTASAQDGSKIAMTGSGTFDLTSTNVTGGGTWQTQDTAGNVTGRGRYRVQSLVRVDMAPGILPCPPFTDNTGNCEDTRAGLLILNIDYLDGSEGILVVSCHLQGTPDSVFEGITASKGFVDFWKHETGATLFHMRR